MNINQDMAFPRERNQDAIKQKAESALAEERR